MIIYLATNGIPPTWMFEPNDEYVNSPSESTKRIQELDRLDATPFVWIEEKKKFLPLKSYKKGEKPKIQDYGCVVRWEI